MKIRCLGLLSIMLLAGYPIVELTRVIVISGNFYFPGMHYLFALEIAAMWILYLSIVPVYLLFTRPALHPSGKKDGDSHVKG